MSVVLDHDLLKMAEKLLLRGFVIRFDFQKGLIVQKTYAGRRMEAILFKGFPHRAAFAAAKLDEHLLSEAEKILAGKAAGEESAQCMSESAPVLGTGALPKKVSA